MTLWLVRAGPNGEGEDWALEEGMAVIGWQEMPNLSAFADRDALRTELAKHYPAKSPAALTNWAGQLYTFAARMQIGDLVALPLKARSAVAIGKVEGDYIYQSQNPDFRHVRKVKWLAEFARTAFDQDLLYSLGAFMTVCQIQRGNAEARVQAMLSGSAAPLAPVPADDPDPVKPDPERQGRDMITALITERFKTHDLERLVEGILKVQGYQVHRTRPGADGGVDLLAGRGPLGFDAPRLAVQVKSSKDAADVKVVRELQGVLQDFGAEHGLFISWGGFNKAVYAEERKRFFNIRLWDADLLVDALLDCYDRLSPELQSELPLKRIWTVVPETDQS
ncbi:restriction endonuclease [Deinococcus altitudinis]|uniref:restriction endonuclease n=1 Tax=Deinococcus altitudinis TaxID=468914 RepID=UPI0038929475